MVADPPHPAATIGAFRWISGLARFLPAVIGIAVLVWLWRQGAAGTEAILAATARVPVSAIAMSLLASAVSYLVLAGYDVIGLNLVAPGRLPAARTGLIAVTACAIGHTLGFPAMTAGAVRLRLYGRAGLAPAETAAIAALSALTLWIGLTGVIGVAALAAPAEVARIDHLSIDITRLAGAGLLGLALFLPLGLRPLLHRLMPARGAPSPMPAPAIGLLQLGLGIADMLATAAALWVLLPAGTVPFAAFAVAVALAVVAGLISHAPGGLGAFDLTLAALLPGVAPADLAAALTLFRLTYYLVPFSLALAVLAADYLDERQPTLIERLAGLRRAVRPLMPPVLGLMIFAGGAVLLLSGAMPSELDRMRALRHLVPLPFVEASHVAASLSGVALMVLAHGLNHRLGRAWLATVALLTAGAIFSIVKGFDWEEAGVMLVLLAALAINRDAFYRKAPLREAPMSTGWWLAIAAAMAGAVWIGLEHAFEIAPDAGSGLLWFSAWKHDAPRLMRAAAALALTLAGMGMHRLLHRAVRAPDPAGEGHPTLADVAPLVERAARADANLALTGDKQFMLSPEADAFLMYRVQGRSWVVMGDPVGEPAAVRELVWRFREKVDEHGGWPVFYQVSAHQLPLYLDAGLALFKLGEEAHVPLDRFTTEGRAGRDWRNMLNRADREGLVFDLIPQHAVAARLDELEAVSGAWLADRQAGEKEFSLGAFSRDYIARTDVAVIRRQGEIVAFANLWRGADRREMSVDLMRHRPDAPRGVMDLLFCRLLLLARSEGYVRFNLGMAPLTGLSDHPLAPLWSRLALRVGRHGERLYNFAGLRAYKAKFGPDWQPMYLACPGGWSLPAILIDIATLIAGGTRRIFTP